MEADKAIEPDNPSVEIEAFLNLIWGNSEGYVYTPTKNIESNYWQPYFFKWPSQRDAVITHLVSSSKDKDTYVAPSLFKAPSDKKPAWKESNYVWVEFDGNAPKNPPPGIPSPSLRIQSSVSRNEHWYWKLDEVETNYHALEGLAKSLTYTLDADKSGWDCSQVLRPPGTVHQESKKRVRLLSSNSRSFNYEDFKNLVKPPESAVIGTTFDNLPDVQEVVAKYRWPEDASKLFNKPSQPLGSRSSAMTRLGFHCIEMGMTNEECYVVLYNADERWGKYKNRSPADRSKRLVGIITHCRGKKELDTELNLSKRESFISLGDFRNTSIEVKWLYKDFLTERGLGIISALPGVGKSTLSVRFGISLALAKDFLVWSYQGKPEGLKVGFLSLEMAGMECRKIIEDMWPSFTTAEQEIIDRNFYILPLGYSMALSNKAEQQMILDDIDNHKLDVLIIDSLKASTGLDEKKIDTFFDWINKYVRNDRGCTVWIIHHNRKPPNEGPRKPRGLEDLYGDTFIGAHPTTVIALWRRAKGVFEVLPLKIRLAEETDPFVINRKKYLDFKVDLKSLLPKEEEEDKKKEGSKKDDLFK